MEETLFVTLHRLFAAIAKASADHAPETPTTPTKATGPLRGTSTTGKGYNKASNGQTKQPSRPATASGTSRLGATSATTGTSPSNATVGAGGVKRKDQGISAGPIDHEVMSSFLAALRRENVLFKSREHQDAHEFLNFILNGIGENLEAIEKERRAADTQTPTTAAIASRAPTSSAIQRLFEGTLTNETRCLTCEAVTSRDESFLDLSIDLEHNTSVTACLRQFSASETLRARDKFFCDTCSGLQEAEKRMKVRKLPAVLALHLKRFKYEEAVNEYVKVAYKVVFPFQLRLFNTTDDADDPDRLYELFGIVIHIGIRPTQGHYVSIVKVGSKWAVFDDDAVHYIDQLDISKYFGDSPATGSAYVLFYQSVDLDRDELGLPQVSPEEAQAQLLPLAMANLAANPAADRANGTQDGSGTGTGIVSHHLAPPVVASPTGSASPMSTTSGSPAKSPSLQPSTSESTDALNTAGSSPASSSLWSRRRGNSNSLAQAAEQARAQADLAVSSSSSAAAGGGGVNGTSSSSHGAAGGSSSWRMPFGKSKDKDRVRRSASVSESGPPASLAAVTHAQQRHHQREATLPESRPTSGTLANGSASRDASGISRDVSPAKSASGTTRGKADASPERQRRSRESDKKSNDGGHGLAAAATASPVPVTQVATPERPQRHPRRPSTAAGVESAVADKSSKGLGSTAVTESGKRFGDERAPASSPQQRTAGRSPDERSPVPPSSSHSPPLRSSTLPTQGAAFAPLDRPLNKKEQQKVAKHAKARRSSTGVPAGSLLVGGEGEPPPQPPPPAMTTGTTKSADAPLGQERRLPSTMSGGGDDAAAASAAVKQSRRRSTLSRAFGLGKKDKK